MRNDASMKITPRGMQGISKIEETDRVLAGLVRYRGSHPDRSVTIIVRISAQPSIRRKNRVYWGYKHVRIQYTGRVLIYPG